MCLSDPLVCHAQHTNQGYAIGAGVVQRLCNGLPRDGPGSNGNGVKIELNVFRKGQ